MPESGGTRARDLTGTEGLSELNQEGMQSRNAHATEGEEKVAG